MQDKKQTIGLFLSVVLSVGLVVIGVNAATTVGNAVSVGSTLAVTATTTLNGDVVLGNATADNIAFTGQIGGDMNVIGRIIIGASGFPITKHLSATSSVNFAAINALDCATSSVTVTGAAVGDTVYLGTPNEVAAATSTVMWNAWVAATNTVYVRVCNIGSSAATPNFDAGVFRVDVWQH